MGVRKTAFSLSGCLLFNKIGLKYEFRADLAIEVSP